MYSDRLTLAMPRFLSVALITMSCLAFMRSIASYIIFLSFISCVSSLYRIFFSNLEIRCFVLRIYDSIGIPKLSAIALCILLSYLLL